MFVLSSVSKGLMLVSNVLDCVMRSLVSHARLIRCVCGLHILCALGGLFSIFWVSETCVCLCIFLSFFPLNYFLTKYTCGQIRQMMFWEFMMPDPKSGIKLTSSHSRQISVIQTFNFLPEIFCFHNLNLRCILMHASSYINIGHQDIWWWVVTI